MSLSSCRIAWATVLVVVALVFLGQTKPTDAAKPSTYSNPSYQFSINPPVFPDWKSGGTLVLFYGPASDGFAPNLNIIVQPNKMSLKDYEDANVATFKNVNFNLISTKETKVDGHDAVLFEFSGTSGGKDVHFLSLNVLTGDRVYILTCTALATQFKNVEQAFRDSLKTFKPTPVL